MSWCEHGRVKGNTIVLPNRLPLPEGAEVAVFIEAVGPAGTLDSSNKIDDFTAMPFFGMWADRDDMADSAEWVRNARAQWQQRTWRQD